MGRCGPELGWNLSEVIEKPGPGTQLLSLPGQTLTQPHLLGSPRAVGRGGGGLCLQGRGAPEGWASAPAHHHQLLLCRLLAEALPHVNGEQGAAAVEDGGE